MQLTTLATGDNTESVKSRQDRLKRRVTDAHITRLTDDRDDRAGLRRHRISQRQEISTQVQLVLR
jgi:hypothetical protein